MSSDYPNSSASVGACSLGTLCSKRPYGQYEQRDHGQWDDEIEHRGAENPLRMGAEWRRGSGT